MPDFNRILVVVDRNPFGSTKGQWARILGVLKNDEISLRWDDSFRQASRNFWKWNIAVCLFDQAKKDAVPVALCENDHLAQNVSSFVSISAAHLREGGFLRLAPLTDVRRIDYLDEQDDAIREALGDASTALPLVRLGELMAAARSECLRRTVQGSNVSLAVVRRIVSRLLRTDEDSITRSDVTEKRKRKKKKKNSAEQQEEQMARVSEFFRLKNAKTYFFEQVKTKAVVAPFACRTFVPNLERFYASRGNHPGYLKTVARYVDGLPPWDRAFVEEWTVLGIETPAPSMDERMVLLQYPNDNGMGYSFAACDSAGLEKLISGTKSPAFSEVYRDDLVLTAIPVDWDMPVDKVIGSTWNPMTWLERIERAADAALRHLIPSLDFGSHKRRVAQTRMWISEEMMAKVTPEGVVRVQGLDKVSVHANLLLPRNVIIWNYKDLRVVYEEMERQDGAHSSWYLDKSITKLRLPACFKRRQDGSYVHRLVPWRGTPADVFGALVHARHDVPPWEGIGMAVFRSTLSKQAPGITGYNIKTIANECDVNFNEAIEAIRLALSSTRETVSVELAPASRPPFVAVRRRKEGNWCVIKGNTHGHATMYFVIDNRARAWIHCHNDKCKTKRLKAATKPYIDLSTARICVQDS